ncbi:hypothetical protein BDV12DRAFT_45363 [Aspergillus spectabilis]
MKQALREVHGDVLFPALHWCCGGVCSLIWSLKRMAYRAAFPLAGLVLHTFLIGYLCMLFTASGAPFLSRIYNPGLRQITNHTISHL